MTEWWETLFEQRYLEFYEAVLDSSVGEEDVSFLERALPLRVGAAVLDLGCGLGRHALPLRRRGYAVTGVELSETMLAQARARAASSGLDLALYRRDLRDLTGLGPFDACLCLYTVFGFFDDAENERVLRGVLEVLSPGGFLVLDVANPLALMPRWPGERWWEVSVGVARERLSYDALSGVLTARRTLFRNTGSKEELPTSRVRMYAPHELVALLERVGFEVEQLHGGLRGQPFRWKSSAQQVWIARVRDRVEPG